MNVCKVCGVDISKHQKLDLDGERLYCGLNCWKKRKDVLAAGCALSAAIAKNTVLIWRFLKIKKANMKLTKITVRVAEYAQKNVRQG